MDTKGLEEAIHGLIATAQSFGKPAIFIIIVTLGVLMGWDLVGALWRFASRGGKPRGPKQHQVW